MTVLACTADTDVLNTKGEVAFASMFAHVEQAAGFPLNR